MLLQWVKSIWYWITWPVKRLFVAWSHKRVEEFSLQPVRLPAKIISVGNITFGGTGKTPTVVWLAKKIRQLDPKLKLGIHLRGYMGEMEQCGGLVFDGVRFFAGPKEAGDEAYLTSTKLKDLRIPVWVGKHKAVEGAKFISRFGLDLVIFDDAYQFTSLARDLDILLIDATRPFGEAGFPREGVLRERLTALERADLVFITRTNLVSGGDLRGIIDKISNHLRPGTNIFLSTFEPASVHAVKSDTKANMELLPTRKAMPLSAIGNPRAFERTLEELDLNTVKPIRYPDHHQFTKSDIQYINRQLIERGAHLIVTTEKDTVRLGKLVNSIEAPVYCLEIKQTIKGEEELLRYINRKLLRSSVTAEQKIKPSRKPADKPVFSVRNDYERIAADAENS